jgi:uncharacterized membrane-anchored protein
MAGEPDSAKPLVRDQALCAEVNTLRGDARIRYKCECSQCLGNVQRALLGQDLSALCLSGGGIRSATFALGALQVLVKHRLFEKFDYLSTVSGGGYIGTSLISWLHRHRAAAQPTPLEQAWDKLDKHRHENYVAVPSPNSTPRDPIEWMRAHSNYLARRLSIFSLDTFTIISTYLRNLFVNWVVFLPWILMFMAAPWVILELLRFLLGRGDISVCLEIGLGVGAWLVYLLLFRMYMYNDSSLQPDRQRPDYDKLVFCLVAGLFFVSVLFTAILLRCIPTKNTFWKNALDDADGLEFALVAVLGPSAILVALGALCALWVAFQSKLPGTEDSREWNARFLAAILVFIVAWPFVASSTLLFPAMLDAWGESVKSAVVAGGGATLSISLYFGYRDSTPGKPGTRPPWFMTLLGTLGIVLVALLLGWASWHTMNLWTGATSTTHECTCVQRDGNGRILAAENGKQEGVKEKSKLICAAKSTDCQVATLTERYRLPGRSASDWHKPWTILAVATFFGLMAHWLTRWRIDYNAFGLHNFYRNRLIRAYYGGFRYPNPIQRNPNPFSGFDPNDDTKLADIANTLYGSTQGSRAPFLVVNTALNLVKGENLAWQERKADSFTFTALHAGNYRLGYRKIDEYAQGGITLGTAMAISGAAFNPNMGYSSSVPMGFLMTLFNVRLGWWLGNPREIVTDIKGQNQAWQQRHPDNPTRTMLMEACGQTTDTTRNIHLSDGGHFENLGLWEMVHRRCRRIVVIDATRDENFIMDDLANAIRKVRIDQGIRIEPIGPVQLFSREKKSQGRYCARFRILYSDVYPGLPTQLNGEILYIKPCIYGTEPEDVLEYARKREVFPHESTVDQFFSESQFESYRRLGEHEMETLMGSRARAARVFSVAKLFVSARRYLG